MRTRFTCALVSLPVRGGPPARECNMRIALAPDVVIEVSIPASTSVQRLDEAEGDALRDTSCSDVGVGARWC